MKINLLTTGGTIDGANSDTGATRPESEAARWLRAQSNLEISIRALFNKDSRLITDSDRAEIVAAVASADSDLILVTHGTFTIALTARDLKHALRTTKKTVILVGAWIPFGEPNSDAPGQMEFALRTLLSRPMGVWIAMDEHVFDPDRTEKVRVGDGFKLIET